MLALGSKSDPDPGLGIFGIHAHFALSLDSSAVEKVQPAQILMAASLVSNAFSLRSPLYRASVVKLPFPHLDHRSVVTGEKLKPSRERIPGIDQK